MVVQNHWKGWVSAPGSLMLLGEHAVLHGRPALVCAINQRIRVHLLACPEREIKIDSALGRYQSSLDQPEESHAFRFVLAAISSYKEALSSGVQLTIESSFSDQIGFGSSAAVTAAVVAALDYLTEKRIPLPEAVFSRGLEIIRKVQGRGSGADLSASVWGGVVFYRQEQPPYSLPLSFPLTAVYCGYKTPTPEVVKRVEQQRKEAPERFETIFDGMEKEVLEAWKALEAGELQKVGAMLNRGETWMKALGVTTPELDEIVQALQADPQIFGAKISGSGLGDCAVGWGRSSLRELAYPCYELEIDAGGLCYE
jgi:mevalonate kinase